ncbi:hypothetical protein JQ613_29400 [Bradyrhizobium japonicum]|nr:hypothetical protein [Bradyrhizobium japonicum]
MLQMSENGMWHQSYRPLGDRLIKAAVAGLCGSLAHSLLMYLKTRTGFLPSFQPYESLQRALGELTGMAIHPILPWALSFLNGSTIVGVFFGYSYRSLPGRNGAIKGALFGILGWASMGLVFFPLIGLGLFAIRAELGAAPAMLSLAMVLSYSVVMGMVYGALEGPGP